MSKINKERRKEIQQIVEDRLPEANIMMGNSFMIIAIVVFVLWVFTMFDGYIQNKFTSQTILFCCVVFLAVTGIIAVLRKGKDKWIKYMLLFSLLISLFLVNVVIGYMAPLLIAIPIVLSMLYYNKKFLFFVSSLSIISIFVTTIINAFCYNTIGQIDLNIVKFDALKSISVDGYLVEEVIASNPNPITLLKTGLLLYVVPNIVVYLVITFCCLMVIRKNLDIVMIVEDLTKKQNKYNEDMLNLRTKLALSQIQPHFMYNTLTTIGFLCKKDPDEAQKITKKFSDYLRINLQGLGTDDKTTFTKELDHARTYLEIEKKRFGDRINIELDIECDEFQLPILTLQPVVENAVKHGVCKKDDGGTVKISTSETMSCYKIVVEDDGVGFDINKPKNDGKIHVGIENVKHRIETISKGSVVIESAVGKGTKVTILIPKEK